MKAGDITELLKTPAGYQLLKLESKSETTTAPFDTVRDKISDRVVVTKRQEEYQKYLLKLRSEAIIEWRNLDVKRAYDAGLERTKAPPSPIPQ